MRAWMMVSIVAAVVAGCGSQASPSPAPVPAAQISVSYAPNPPMWSGRGDASCVGSGGSLWTFSSTFTESAGVAVTLSAVITIVDGQTLPTQVISVLVPARGSATSSHNVCHVSSVQHSVQQTFTGTDSQGRPVSVTAPALVLAGRS